MDGVPVGVQWHTLSKPLAVIACISMALFYVAVLYAPTLILRLPPPENLQRFMIRRFICSAVSTLCSIIACTILLPVGSIEIADLFGVFGIRLDHLLEAIVFPLLLTSTMYAGSMGIKVISLLNSLKEEASSDGGHFWTFFKRFFHLNVETGNMLAWRNYVVAPLTEELVFRACMISLLICGGFEIRRVILLGPILFSLAHLNHWMRTYVGNSYSLLKTSMVIGLQLGYTVLFGSYATFLYIRTGHLLAPLVAHMFCNFMGLPAFYSSRKGILMLAFGGVAAFLALLFPLTNPSLYNNKTVECRCWHGYCSWTSVI